MNTSWAMVKSDVLSASSSGVSVKAQASLPCELMNHLLVFPSKCAGVRIANPDPFSSRGNGEPLCFREWQSATDCINCIVESSVARPALGSTGKLLAWEVTRDDPATSEVTRVPSAIKSFHGHLFPKLTEAFHGASSQQSAAFRCRPAPRRAWWLPLTNPKRPRTTNAQRRSGDIFGLPQQPGIAG